MFSSSNCGGGRWRGLGEGPLLIYGYCCIQYMRTVLRVKKKTQITFILLPVYPSIDVFMSSILSYECEISCVSSPQVSWHHCVLAVHNFPFVVNYMSSHAKHGCHIRNCSSGGGDDSMPTLCRSGSPHRQLKTECSGQPNSNSQTLSLPNTRVTSSHSRVRKGRPRLRSGGGD